MSDEQQRIFYATLINKMGHIFTVVVLILVIVAINATIGIYEFFQAAK